MNKKVYRKIPGWGNKYCVNNEGEVYSLRAKRHLAEQESKSGRKFYKLLVYGQTYEYSGMSLRAMAFATGIYDGNEKGEIVYIDMEENKVC